MRGKFRLALLASLVALTAASNTTDRRLFASKEEERLIGWQGEKSRPQRAPRVIERFGGPTEGDRYHQEDLERGTWVEIISWHPRAFIIHNFLTPDEADKLIEIAKPMMTRSTVVDSVTGESKVDDIRTSAQTFLNRNQYPLVTELEKRLTRFTLLPWENGEDLQILRYGVGEKYDAHHDVGELDSVSGKQLAARSSLPLTVMHVLPVSQESDGGYRVATSLWYLVDTEEGGETAFPDSEWADPKLAAGKWSECAQDRVASRSRKGEALVFFSITPGNEIDPASMHAGCPPVKGIKWTATKWIHATPFRWVAPKPPPAPVGCADKNPTCKAWASMGECKKNKPFMIGEPSNPGACIWSCKKCTEEFQQAANAHHGGEIL